VKMTIIAVTPKKIPRVVKSERILFETKAS